VRERERERERGIGYLDDKLDDHVLEDKDDGDDEDDVYSLCDPIT